MTKVAEAVRITPARVDPSATQKIIDYVAANPGAAYKQIIKALPLVPHGSVSSGLWRLCRDKRLKCAVLDGAKRYYPISSNVGGFQKFVSGGVERAFRCLEPECGREFDSKQALAMHHYRVHTEDGRAVAQRGGLALHKKAEQKHTGVTLPSFTTTLVARAKDYCFRNPENAQAVRDFVSVELIAEREGGGEYGSH